MDDSWSAALEVTNLFDKYYYLTLFDNVESGGNQVDGQPGHPREWAITLKKKF
jgi:iron complex outermembrane receptor protein